METGQLVQICVNVVLGVVVSVVGFSIRRMIRENDREHAKLEKSLEAQRAECRQSLEKVEQRIDKESEVRHTFHAEMSDRTWELSTDMRDNFAPRKDVMRMFGSLVQKIEDNGRQTLERLDTLPCRKPKCPSEDQQTNQG